MANSYRKGRRQEAQAQQDINEIRRRGIVYADDDRVRSMEAEHGIVRTAKIFRLAERFNRSQETKQ